MSTSSRIQDEATPAIEPVRRQWSRSEYYRMADLGWFDGQRTELVEGEVVVVNPQRFPHYASIDKVASKLTAAFGEGVWVRIQAPLACDDLSEPEPDVSVVAGVRDDYTDHPTSAMLVVEVSESTLSFDRTRKMSLYARAGVAEYWIVNLVDRVLEVYRDPAPDGEEPFGFGYRDVRRFAAGEILAPLQNPDAEIHVDDLLP